MERIAKEISCMTPADIIALGQTLYGELWLEKMAADLEYSVSQLWRVAYDSAPVTKRMQREPDKLAKRKPKATIRISLSQVKDDALQGNQ
jgi:hypothetical protein